MYNLFFFKLNTLSEFFTNNNFDKVRSTPVNNTQLLTYCSSHIVCILMVIYHLNVNILYRFSFLKINYPFRLESRHDQANNQDSDTMLGLVSAEHGKWKDKFSSRVSMLIHYSSIHHQLLHLSRH